MGEATAVGSLEPLRQRLESVGLRLRLSDDMAAFWQASALLGRDPPAAIFDPGVAAVRPRYWLGVYGEGGQLCGCHAMVLLGETAELRTLILTLREELMPQGRGIDPGRSDVAPASGRVVSGRIAYHGEGFLAAAWRRRGFGRYVVRYHLLTAAARWQPDAVFAFLVRATSSPRFAAAMGYAGFEAEAVTWRTAEGRAVATEGLCYAGKARLRALGRDPFTGLEERPSGRRLRQERY